MNRDGVVGPFGATVDDIPALNEVFSDAFTERYRRDGMAGVRVPALNPAIWRFAIEDADQGAMLWRDANGAVVAFNIAHRSGAEGWMGPLAVRPDAQARGLGQLMVRTGVTWLESQGARVIGLETMPRTADNIGFYSRLGFLPGRLTVTFTVESEGGAPVERIGRHDAAGQDHLVAECAALANEVLAGYDYTREIQLTAALDLGDTLILRAGKRLAGFAICHAAPLVEGRVREELRVLKVVLKDGRDVPLLLSAIARYAREAGAQRAAIRVQSEYEEAYRAVVAAGGRVRWTDLRMSVDGYQEVAAPRGVVLSNWEI